MALVAVRSVMRVMALITGMIAIVVAQSAFVAAVIPMVIPMVVSMVVSIVVSTVIIIISAPIIRNCSANRQTNECAAQQVTITVALIAGTCELRNHQQQRCCHHQYFIAHGSSP